MDGEPDLYPTYNGQHVRVTRLVTAGSPHYGATDLFLNPWCSESDVNVQAEQTRQLAYGSPFLKRVHINWERMLGTQRAIAPDHVLTVVGCGSLATLGVCASDGVVQPHSATLPVPPVHLGDYHIAHMQKDHVSILPSSGLVDVAFGDTGHPTLQVVERFLRIGSACLDGSTKCLYQPKNMGGLLVAPLVDEGSGMPFTGDAAFAPLSSCTKKHGLTFNFEQRDPAPGDPPSGWWTLFDVTKEKWWVTPTSPQSVTEPQCITVRDGRPVVLPEPIVVRR